MSQNKPITSQILLALRNQLNWDDPWHATFWAVCLIAFFGLLRKANLLCKGSTQSNPSKHLRRRGNILFANWAIVIKRWSKTIQFSQRILTIPLRRIDQHPLCPYTALKHAFNLVLAPLSGPSFVVPASRGPIPLTYRKFDPTLKSLVASISLSVDIVFVRLGPPWPFRPKFLPNLLQCNELNRGHPTFFCQSQHELRTKEWEFVHFRQITNEGLAVKICLFPSTKRQLNIHC